MPQHNGWEDIPYFEPLGLSREEDQKRVELLGSCPRYRSRTTELRRFLRRGLLTMEPQRTLASSLYMRELRAELIGALIEAVAGIPGNDLRIVTVINQNWCIDAADLDDVSATTIKRQFRTHLERAGVLARPGLFVGFLHGEFEPCSRTYQLHYHLVTTRDKSQAILDGLRGRWGYEKTCSGAAPIKRQRLKDRRAQLSYLFKAYWPQRAVIEIDGEKRRVRKPIRIVPPNHSQVLLWLHNQKLQDLMIMNRCLYRGGNFIIQL